ncbi:hypothetical protein [Jiangella asiatica]|uniref:Uncharacterized protein n=1 Tax=Jiangella asiatica TaxID=2530372 RepID=A0A4R5DNH6_9ACTN|nr:hypothetical protein [Jiangella asiatica]TDE15107.1 hypothetical protein E1269_03105 [Jiangella asiatica]
MVMSLLCRLGWHKWQRRPSDDGSRYLVAVAAEKKAKSPDDRRLIAARARAFGQPARGALIYRHATKDRDHAIADALEVLAPREGRSHGR